MSGNPLSDIEGRTFDVAIVGGGINGTATADLLSRSGYDVLLVERNDFGSGATSRSGRVNHCGLRYFDRGEPVWNFIKRPGWFLEQVRRARATMKHRAEMALDYSNYMQATTMILPVRQSDHASPWMISAAFKLLEALGPSSVPLDARHIPRSDWDSTPYIKMMQSDEPLKGVFSFREYQYYWPERLAVDYALAAEGNGAFINNHVAVEELARRDGGGWRLILRGKGQNYTVTCNARLVINAAGAWADSVAGLTGEKAKKRIAATKGTFLVVELPEDCAGHSIATFDRRGYPFYSLAVPGYHTIGPTEWPNDQNLDRPVSQRDDIESVLDNFNALFPRHRLSPKDVCYCWTGIRPMPHKPEVEGKQNLIPELHDHAQEGMPDLLTLAGGPLMVHRITAKTIHDTIKKRLRPKRDGVARGRTQGAVGGSRCFDVREMKALEPDAMRRLVLDEHVATLSDLLFRRLGTGWYPGMALDDAPRMAQTLGQTLGWSAEQIEAELANYKREIQEFECPTSQD